MSRSIVRILCAGLLSGSLLCGLEGCVALPQHQVTAPPSPTLSALEQISVYVDLRYYEGTPDDATPSGTAYNLVQGIALQAMHDSGVFSTVGFADSSKTGAQRYLRLSVYEQTAHVLPVMTAVVSYFTVFLFPTIGNSHFIVHLDVIDPKTGKVIGKEENQDSIHRYSGLLEVPLAMAGKDLSKALNQTLSEQIKAVVLEAWKSGAFATSPVLKPS